MVNYIAISEIGNYKPGDKVPEELAKVWIKMYKFKPVVDEETYKIRQKDGTADMVIEEPEEVNYSKMTVNELTELAKSLEIEVPEKIIKKDLIALIQSKE